MSSPLNSNTVNSYAPDRLDTQSNKHYKILRIPIQSHPSTSSQPKCKGDKPIRPKPKPKPPCETRRNHRTSPPPPQLAQFLSLPHQPTNSQRVACLSPLQSPIPPDRSLFSHRLPFSSLALPTKIVSKPGKKANMVILPFDFPSLSLSRFF